MKIPGFNISGVHRRSAGRLPHVWTCLVSCCVCLCADAQTNEYTIDFHTIDGGGGTSTDEVYSVAGTFGQPDAGNMSGGDYSVSSGFWSVVAAVQTPDAPYLSVAVSNDMVIISWPLSEEDWNLEFTTALTNEPSHWMPIPSPYQTNSVNLQFVEPSPVGVKFYRLQQP